MAEIIQHVANFLNNREEDIFQSFKYIMFAYALLILVPRWRLTKVITIIVPFAYALVYLAIVTKLLYYSPDPLKVFDQFGTLSGVKSIFKETQWVLAGWDHYIVFDFFVSRWEVYDAQKIGIPHVLVVPCIVFTFLLGPVGWASYMVLRSIGLLLCRKNGEKGQEADKEKTE
eukprot:TRINITY_DN12240_c0_g1_i1.p1 TRINITY_DN12240_c0_g1~~TRINITY_DN12240_c0_g1_i1.p1  ORF type:complete len:172 (-),score=13.63 TRINITY_DN12240_c0_g1_i1:19-534(-)